MLFRIRGRDTLKRLLLARASRTHKRNCVPKMLVDHQGRDCIRLLDMWDDLHDNQADPVYADDEVIDCIDPSFGE